MQPLLTIAIPTYNRPHRVLERLRELIPQCHGMDQIEILVVDNASAENVENHVLAEIPEAVGRVRFHRNVANIGLAANICRCFEVALGSWVWTLGDDDSVLPDAVPTIVGAIHRYKDNPPGGFNFSTGIHTYECDQTLATLEEYCKLMSHPKAFSNALFLSSCVFRLDVFHKYLRCAYLYVASAAPHIALPVQALIEGTHFAVIKGIIVNWIPPASAEQWNSLAVAKSLPLLGEIGDCNPTLGAFVHGYRLHLPGELSLKVGLKRIFSNEGRTPLYWSMYYSRISPYLNRNEWMRASICSILAGLAHRSNHLKSIGNRICQHLAVETHQSAGNTDRL